MVELHPHDIHSTIFSIALAIFGTLIPIIASVHIPPIVIELAQLVSYIGAIVIAYINIKKHFKSKR